MRISDWSSDVCSSDLAGIVNLCARVPVQWRFGLVPIAELRDSGRLDLSCQLFGDLFVDASEMTGLVSCHRICKDRSLSLKRDRTSVVSGKSVSVRVDLVGRRLIKTTHHAKNTT